MTFNEAMANPVATGKNGCCMSGKQDVQINVPVSISAGCDAGDIQIQCNGAPKISHGTGGYVGTPGTVSQFVISQTLGVSIPLCFNASAAVGVPANHFPSTPGNGCDCDCDCDCGHKDPGARPVVRVLNSGCDR